MSSAHMGPAVVFDQVYKAFGPHQVLRDVSFSVPAGQVLCILGRSGTGKSVTLKLLMALLKPDRGSIRVDGDDIPRLKPIGLSKVRRKMGFLFQDAALFDSLTLYENLALPLARLTMKTQAEIDFAINNVLRDVELAHDKDKLPSDLSGGMRKRAGLARALVLEPKVLLADEPSSGLDRITASEIDELLLRQKRDKGVTILVVTHDVHGANAYSDRLVLLHEGSIAAEGSFDDLQSSQDEFVKQFFSYSSR